MPMSILQVIVWFLLSLFLPGVGYPQSCDNCGLVGPQEAIDEIGLVAGDTLISIDGKKPKDEDDATAMLAKLKADPQALSRVLRIERGETEALLKSCVALPLDIQAYRETIANLQKKPFDPQRATWITSFQGYLETLPRQVEGLNFSRGIECVERILRNCIRKPEPDYCPLPSDMPFLYLSSRPGGGDDYCGLDTVQLKAFFASIKDEKNDTFYDLLGKSHQYWEMLTDDQGCQSYGRGLIARECYGWSEFHRKYPKAYTDTVERNAKISCEALLNPGNICEATLESVLREEYEYLKLDGSSSTAEAVRRLLNEYPKLFYKWTFGSDLSDTETFTSQIACDESDDTANPSQLEWRGEFEAASGEQNLVLFKDSRSCRGLFSSDYKSKHPIRLFLNNASCDHATTKVSFELFDPKGLVIFPDGGKLRFEGQYEAEHGIRGELTDVKSGHKQKVDWPMVKVDAIRQEARTAEFAFLRKNCSKEGKPSILALEAQALDINAPGKETTQKIADLFCPSYTQNSYFYEIIAEAQHDAKARERLAGMVSRMTSDSDEHIWDCPVKLLSSPKTMELPRPLYEFAVNVLTPVFAQQWERNRFISLLPVGYSHALEGGWLKPCLGDAAKTKPACQYFDYLLSTLEEQLKKKLAVLERELPPNFNKNRAKNIENAISGLTKLRSKVKK